MTLSHFELDTHQDNQQQALTRHMTPLVQEYFDTEWGNPVTTEKEMFELLGLEVFVVGLSWNLILRKRDALRRAIFNNSIETIARWGEADVEALLSDDTIIRNRRKINAVITNAQAALALRDEGTDLAEFLWSFEPTPQSVEDTKELVKALKVRGFTMLGPVTVFALLQCTGITS
ncbi:DNA-3-methyladenine glycosylase I [Corynebacterium tuscaniense]|uniref:DNA-3-methyladenine glycosylase I n=1 Tax=Corynebacterium tuscaniense TaxID=302449 RepID=UPI001E3B5239|nr:DNA-3-methyladenine glycosylase I [Corynebacterium tuscaniense]